MSDRLTAITNRRTILKAGGTLALAGLITPAATVAQTDLPIEIEIFAEEEYVVLHNVGDEELDITGYSLNFDAEGGEDQIRQLAGDVVLGPGDEVSVGTGEQTTIDPDVELTDPYDSSDRYNGYRLNNDDPDTVALLDPDGNVVASSEGEVQDPGDGGDGGDDGDNGDGGDGGDDGDDGDGGDDESGDDETGDDESGDGGTDDGDSGDDGDEDDESTDGSDDECEEERDADGDGVVATDDADDDCAKVS